LGGCCLAQVATVICADILPEETAEDRPWRVKDHAPVQMWPAGAPGFTGKPEQLAFADDIACLHLEAVKVTVHGNEAIA